MENKDWKKKFNEQFRNSAGSLITNDPYTFNEMSNFISTSIAQAEQEMMKKVVEIVNFIDYDFLADLSNEEKYPVEYSINFERKRIRTALSSLDKPLTEKE